MNELVTPDSYSISFKDANGNWVPIPGFYQTAYRAYVEHCNKEAIDPISVDAFYGVFNMLSNTEFLDSLIEAIGKTGGTLPIEMGGTGATTAEAARNQLAVYSKDQVDQLINGLSARVTKLTEKITTLEASLDAISLPGLGIHIGEDEPDETVIGSIYFRVDAD